MFAITWEPQNARRASLKQVARIACQNRGPARGYLSGLAPTVSRVAGGGELRYLPAQSPGDMVIRMKNPPPTSRAQTLRSGLLEFGPLLIFWVLLWTVELKIAIGVGVACMLLDAAYRRWRGLPISKLYLLSGGLTVLFGCIDLLVQTPFLLKYEDVITSLVIAVVFAWGARGEKSMIQGLVEQQQGDAFEDGPDMRRFFKLFTWIWAGYFLLKAGVYAWLGEIMPIEEALTLRPVVGMVSLGAMVLLSLKAQYLFDFAAKIGWLPKVAGQA